MIFGRKRMIAGGSQELKFDSVVCGEPRDAMLGLHALYVIVSSPVIELAELLAMKMIR